jgi:hypothetical protein
MDVLTLTGLVKIEPDADDTTPFPLSANISLAATLSVAAKLHFAHELTSDGAFSVPLGGLTKVNVLVITVSRKLTVSITSADGATQIIPVDNPGLIHFAGSAGITALSITRQAGADTTVQVLLAQTA